MSPLVHRHRWSRRAVLGVSCLAASAALCVVACTAPRERERDASLRDDYGDPIAFGAPPHRVVSLNPTTTELLFAMGSDGRLVGRSHWDVWPAAAARVPDLGDAIRPNVEAVLRARPDLVILYASEDNRAAAARLRAAGVRCIAFRIDRIADFDRDTRLLGRIVGDSARAATVADSVRRTLARVRAVTARLPHPTVVWPFEYRPAMVLGGGSFLSELLDVAGGRNVYADLPQPSPVVAIEDVVRRNPQYVIRSVDVAQQVTQPLAIDPAWRAVPAVTAGRVLVAPAALVSRPSVQLGEAAVALATLLHPGLSLR